MLLLQMSEMICGCQIRSQSVMILMMNEFFIVPA